MPDSAIRKISDDRLEKVSGGAARPKFVSSFYCEKCKKKYPINSHSYQ